MEHIKTYYKIDNKINLLQDKYINNNEFNIDLFIKNKKISESFNIKFYNIKEEFTFEIKEKSDNLKNIRVLGKFENSNRKERFENILKGFNNSSLYIISENKFNRIIGFINDRISNQYILNLESEFDIDSDLIVINNVNGISDYISIEINDKRVDEELNPVILKGHRKDGLKEIYKNEPSVRKKYSDVISQKNELSVENYLATKDDINIDYSIFDTHVFFGSAYSKVLNVTKKIDVVNELYEKKETTESDDDKNKLKEKINNILDEFTPYEKYVYKTTKNLTPNEYNKWIENQTDLAESYDAKNNNFLLYSVPEAFIDADESNIFTNFILLIGEYMDSLWSATRSIQNLYNFDIHSKEMISEKFIDTILEDLGFDLDYKYTDADFESYFGDEKNLKKVSNEISKRLLYSLPILIKEKGTNTSVRHVLNTFGLPPELLQIYEFGIVSRKNDLKRNIQENDWYVSVDTANFFNVEYNSSELNQENYTIQLVVRNLIGSGRLIEFNASNYIGYETNNDAYRIIIVQGGSTIYTSPYFKNNDLWDFLVIQRDELDGHFLKYTLNNFSENIIDKYEEDYNYSSSTMNFTDIDVFSTGGGDISEFKLFNSTLSKDVIEYHSLDIRSVAEDDDANTLQFRFKFYRPDDDPAEITSSDNKPYVITSNIDRNRFDKAPFSSISILKTSLSSLHSTNKTDYFERDLEYELSSKRISTKFKDVEFLLDLPFFGVFISPSDLYDKNLIRKAGYTNDFVLDDNTEYDYVFENILNKQHLKNRIEYNFFKDSTLFKILDLINVKIYNVLKEFVPSSSKLLTGLLIKNNLLDRNKVLKRRSSLKHHGLPVNKFDTGLINKQSYANRVSGKIDVEPRIVSIPKEKLDALLEVKFDGSNSSVQHPIETFNMFKRSPWLRRVILGNNRRTRMLSAEEIQELFNRGARILVK